MVNKAPERLRFAAVAVDAVLFGIHDGTLQVLIDAVHRPPHYTNAEAFIGGLIDVSETAEEAIVRHLKGKAGLQNVYIEQLRTFSELERDKRNRVISVSYLGLVRPEVVATYKHKTARWCAVADLPKLAYDHDAMFQLAFQRLRGKLTYTTIAQFLLPKTFTLTELQDVYEIVLGTAIDKRNFRKKVLALSMVRDTGKTQQGVKNRPAALYTFTSPTLRELPMVF
ncbi:MAG: NUDIX domain-containing protein [Candidatus Paceibacterota bacterium]